MNNDKIIEMIDNYIEEPHNLSREWVDAFQTCKQALIENEKLTYEVDRLKASVQYVYSRGWAEAVKALTDKLKAIPIFEYHGDHIDKVAKDMAIREIFKD